MEERKKVRNIKFWTEFIEVYRENSCLWDVTSPDYTIRRKRDKSYNILLKKLKELDPAATMRRMKLKIKNMRDAYSRERRNVKDFKRKGTGEAYKPTLWYYDLMRFAAPAWDRRGQAEERGYDLWEEDRALDSEIETLSSFESVPVSPSHLEERTHSTSVNDSHLEERTHTTSVQDIETPILNRSTGKPPKRISRKDLKHKKMELLEMTQELLLNAHNSNNENNSNNESNSNNDYLDIGKRVGSKMQEVDEQQKIIAEKLISEVMFYGKMGTLRDDATILPSLQEHTNSSKLKFQTSLQNMNPVTHIAPLSYATTIPTNYSIRQYIKDFQPSESIE